ncbi:MAG: LEA type 2 family protein [Xanthomonadales bacterium]|nr:LEA type 2 family protein [Xanthomonadales bacterium]
MRTLRLFTLSLALIVAACASAPPKRINPPALSIQRLAMPDSGSADVELRLQNHSDVPMRFATIDLKLRFAGVDAGTLRVQPGIEVAPHNAEVVAVQIDPTRRAEVAGVLADLRDGTVHYQLRGTIDISEPERQYDINFESRLSPVPGKPGEFR